MRRQRLAVIGFGRLGRACADAIAENQDLEPAGIVRRPGSPCTLATPSIPAVEHVRDLARVEAGLLCVPAMTTAGVACELLQQRVPIVVFQPAVLRLTPSGARRAARHSPPPGCRAAGVA
jgi:diaminopimelate dehydrogenase